MQFHITSILVAISSLAVFAAPSSFKLPLPVKIVHQFPAGTWVENLVVRPSGDIIVTILTAPARIYQVSPISAYEPKLLFTWTDLEGGLGITETGFDKYHVAVSNFSDPSNSKFFLYSLEFDNLNNPTVALESPPPGVGLANGLTTLPRSQNVLIADSFGGMIYKFDTKTKKISIFLDSPETKPTASSPVGVNGVKIHDNHLYFTNLASGLLSRVALGPDESAPTGEPELLYTGTSLDDFAIDSKGNLYVCENSKNDLVFVDGRSGITTVIAGSVNDTETLSVPTAAAFGRGKDMHGKLFITTAGASPSLDGAVSVIDVGKL